MDISTGIESTGNVNDPSVEVMVPTPDVPATMRAYGIVVPSAASRTTPRMTTDVSGIADANIPKETNIAERHTRWLDRFQDVKIEGGKILSPPLYQCLEKESENEQHRFPNAAPHVRIPRRFYTALDIGCSGALTHIGHEISCTIEELSTD